MRKAEKKQRVVVPHFALQAHQALKEAVRELKAESRKDGRALFILRNGKVVKLKIA